MLKSPPTDTKKPWTFTKENVAIVLGEYGKHPGHNLPDVCGYEPRLTQSKSKTWRLNMSPLGFNK